MLEIAIEELGANGGKVAYVLLPANRNDVIDALDRAKIYGETFLRIEECDEVPEFMGYEFSEEPTLEELNFLAKRLDDFFRGQRGFYIDHRLPRALEKRVWHNRRSDKQHI